MVATVGGVIVVDVSVARVLLQLGQRYDLERIQRTGLGVSDRTRRVIDEVDEAVRQAEHDADLSGKGARPQPATRGDGYQTCARATHQGHRAELLFDFDGDELTVPAAAAQLGCSTSNVRALLARGTLTGRKIGPQWLLDEDVVRQHIDRRTQ